LLSGLEFVREPVSTPLERKESGGVIAQANRDNVNAVKIFVKAFFHVDLEIKSALLEMYASHCYKSSA